VIICHISTMLVDQDAARSSFGTRSARPQSPLGQPTCPQRRRPNDSSAMADCLSARGSLPRRCGSPNALAARSGSPRTHDSSAMAGCSREAGRLPHHSGRPGRARSPHNDSPVMAQIFQSPKVISRASSRVLPQPRCGTGPNLANGSCCSFDLRDPRCNASDSGQDDWCTLKIRSLQRQLERLQREQADLKTFDSPVCTPLAERGAPRCGLPMPSLGRAAADAEAKAGSSNSSGAVTDRYREMRKLRSRSLSPRWIGQQFLPEPLNPGGVASACARDDSAGCGSPGLSNSPASAAPSERRQHMRSSPLLRAWDADSFMSSPSTDVAHYAGLASKSSSTVSPGRRRSPRRDQQSPHFTVHTFASRKVSVDKNAPSEEWMHNSPRSGTPSSQASPLAKTPQLADSGLLLKSGLSIQAHSAVPRCGLRSQAIS